jgi:hypothetical protein
MAATMTCHLQPQRQPGLQSDVQSQKEIPIGSNTRNPRSAADWTNQWTDDRSWNTYRTGPRRDTARIGQPRPAASPHPTGGARGSTRHGTRPPVRPAARAVKETGIRGRPGCGRAP